MTKYTLRRRVNLCWWLTLLLIAALLVAPLPGAATLAKNSLSAPRTPTSQSLSCATVCFRGPQYYLTHLDRLPHGVVLIPGVNFNTPVGADDSTAIRLALRGGDSAQQRLNRHFVAAQLSLLASGGTNQAALQSRLSCYGLDFAPVRLGNNTTLRTSTTLGELLVQVQSAVREGRSQDFEDLADFLDSLNSDDPLGRCGVDLTVLRVIDLTPNPTSAELAAARRAYLRGQIVRMLGGTAATLQRLLGVSVSSARALDKPSAGQEAKPAQLQFVAVRATANGALHEFHGLTSAAGGNGQEAFTNWLRRENQLARARAALTAGSGPNPQAWTELQEITQTTESPSGRLSSRMTTYRLNDKNSSRDWYLLTHTPETKPNVIECGGTDTSCGWIVSHRSFKIESNHPLYEHEPQNEITKTEASFDIGVGLGAEGPEADVGFGVSWEQGSVTTHDLSGDDEGVAQWTEDFQLRDIRFSVPDTTKGLFASNQAVIYEVPEGTAEFKVKLSASVEWVIQSIYNTITPLPDNSNSDTFGAVYQSQMEVEIPIYAPVLSVSSDTLVIPPGGQGTFQVTAGIPKSRQGLSWKVNTNQSWLSVSSPDADFSGSEAITVTVAPGTSSGTPGGVITINTDPPFAAPSVVSGPLQVNIVVGQPQAPTSGVLLVDGATPGGVVGVAEVYDPTTKTTIPVGSLNTPRTGHTATALANGDILIVGGETASGHTTATAELYQPATGAFVPVKGAASCRPHPGVSQPGCLTESRRNHTATLLPNGQVLIAGGYTEDGGDRPVATAELYDPATQTFTPTAHLNSARAHHAAILHPIGAVLIVGGVGQPPPVPNVLNVLMTAEWYWPGDRAFAPQALAFPQTNSELYFYGNDVESVGGGDNRVQSLRLLNGQGAWQNTASLNQGRSGHRVTKIGDAIGLVTGGFSVDEKGQGHVLATIEQKDQSNNLWRVISGGAKCPGNYGCLLSPRIFHTATTLGGTTVLIAGGQDDDFLDLGTTELYDTYTGNSVAGPKIIPRSQQTATPFKRP